MAHSLLVSSATLPSPTLLSRAGERREGQGREGAVERKEGPSKVGVARSAYSCLLSLSSSLHSCLSLWIPADVGGWGARSPGHLDPGAVISAWALVSRMFCAGTLHRFYKWGVSWPDLRPAVCRFHPRHPYPESAGPQKGTE